MSAGGHGNRRIKNWRSAGNRYGLDMPRAAFHSKVRRSAAIAEIARDAGAINEDVGGWSAYGAQENAQLCGIAARTAATPNREHNPQTRDQKPDTTSHRSPPVQAIVYQKKGNSGNWMRAECILDALCLGCGNR